MARLAKALQVIRIEKPTARRDRLDVVNLRCERSPSTTLAVLAERVLPKMDVAQLPPVAVVPALLR